MEDAQRHPLSLKVMRVSRPTLAGTWQPFFSTSPSLSAHSTASVISLQGSTPLPSHPKTLRDLTVASPILTLPASFGAIQLGETFSSCLCVNNEAQKDMPGVRLRVEMQTTTTKILLADVGGSEEGDTLKKNDTMETVVSHEIKELGQHVLACTVLYGPKESQVFRKFYKFTVTNPFSVKTKVYAPRSPTAQFSVSEREKLFLEVHIQNLTQDTLCLHQVRLEPVEGWRVNLDLDNPGDAGAEAGSTSLVQPQDTRQYIYVLAPVSGIDQQLYHPAPSPGSIIPLGRLDISWRSSMGEPGRLLTSVLSRRIPLPAAPPPPVSQIVRSGTPPIAAPTAIPPYLQHHTHRPMSSTSSTQAAMNSSHSRPRSPQLSQAQARSGTPPPRPRSPATNAHVKRSSGPPSRVQSPVPGSSHLSQRILSPPTQPQPGEESSNEYDIGIDLLVNKLPYKSVVVETPFEIDCSLIVSVPRNQNNSVDGTEERRGKDRVIKLAVQHVQHMPYPPPTAVPVESAAGPSTSGPSTVVGSPLHVGSDVSRFGIISPTAAAMNSNIIRPSTLPSPSPYGSPRKGGSFSFAQEDTREVLSLVSSPQTSSVGEDVGEGLGDGTVVLETKRSNLPSPILDPERQWEVVSSGVGPSGTVLYLGDSVMSLPVLKFLEKPSSIIEDATPGRSESVVDFKLSFVPMRPGFARVGGLRVLLLEDRLDYGTEFGSFSPLSDVRILKEWDVIAEIWANLITIPDIS